VTSTIDLARESSAEVEVGGIQARSPLELFWRRLRDDRVAMISLGFIIFLVLVAICAPLIIKLVGARPPNAQATKYLDSFGTPTGPSKHNVMGVDPLGRDVFSRVLYGARVSLEVAIIATVIGVFIGVVLGTLAGFYGGLMDTVVSRMTEIVMAFPLLLFAIGIAATIGGRLNSYTMFGIFVPGIVTLIIIISVFSWYYPARIVRAQVLSLREKEYVEAAKMVGCSNFRIMRSHLLPHLVGTIIVYGTLTVATNILFEAALSYLGVGLPPPNASWGNLLSDAVTWYTVQPWLIVWPGVAILITTLAFNLLGDGLRDAIDPRSTL
jgi:peptide/nickel transport system permease protein